MTAQLSDAQIHALAEQNGMTFERAKFLLGSKGSQPRVTVVEPRTLTSAATGGYVEVVGPWLTYPIRLVLPWSALVSENRRFCARESRIFMTAQYKAAREKIVKAAREAMTVDGSVFAPLERPLSLVARVWFPDNRIHDAPNFAGATHNALKKIVFVDDQWLHDVRWIRAGVDVDRPRAEIEIRPL